MKNILKIILAAMLVLALPLVSAFDANVESDFSRTDVLKKDNAMEKIPATYELAVKEMSILPIQHWFLLYTNNGKNVMWGEFSRGYFKAEDNHGKYTWGIYGQDVFAGFYDGKFFWGRYRNGNWKAYGLFNLRSSKGKFVVFPSPVLRPQTISSAQIVTPTSVAAIK